MRSPFAYTPRGGPLDDADALAASVFLGAFTFVAFAVWNPIVLAGAGCAVAVAGRAAGAGRALRAALRWGLWLAVIFVAVNAVTAQRGDTILVRGFDAPLLGQIDISGEALLEGTVLGLRVIVVLLAFAVLSASIDPNRLLRLLRPVARHSALTATLITRMVPLAAADHARLREAAALRGPAAAPVGRAAMARRLVAGSLDRAIDVSATLELRGYARGAPRSPGSARRSRYSWRFLAAGIAVIALAAGARIAGFAQFDPYPLVAIDADAATLLLALSLPLLAALPFAGAGRRR